MKRLIIYVSLFLSGSLAHAASFDCAKASTAIEKTICADDQISALDSRLMTAYKAAQSASTAPEEIKAAQKAWLQITRNKCENAECLKTAYINRIASLESGSTAKSADISSAKDEPANIPNENPSEANPSEKIEAPAVQIEQSSESKILSPTVSDETSSIQRVDHVDVEPSSPIADVLFGVAGLIGIALVAGLIKPKWIIRWSEKPTRLKVIGHLIPLLLVVSIAAPMLRTKDRQEYDLKVAAASKAKAKAEAEEKAQRQEEKRLASQNNKAIATSSPTTQGNQVAGTSNPHINEYKRVEQIFLQQIKTISKSREYNDPNKFDCRQVADSAYSKYKNEILEKLISASKTEDVGYINGVLDLEVTILGGLSTNLTNYCGVN